MIRLAFGLVAAIAATSSASAQTCAGSPVAVQILGSGGPTFNAERASASYLLWVGAQAKLLFDIGGGAHLRGSGAEDLLQWSDAQWEKQRAARSKS